jgi:2-dehydropantoate 2-reductase
MKILIVGPGAVGQVLGLHLQKAGMELGYYARSRSAEKLRLAYDQGELPLFQLTYTRRKDPIPHQLKHYEVVTNIDESRRFEPDQIWFTVPSTVYYTPWFREFLHEVPANRVVCFAPEGRREEFLRGHGGKGGMIFGGITFIAWQGDLAGGGGRPERVNFWLPPGIEIPLVGDYEGCVEVADLLNTAGLRAGAKKETFGRTQAAVSAAMSTFVSGLEVAGWSLSGYRGSAWLKKAARASREAAAGQLRETGLFTSLIVRSLTSSTTFSLVTLILPLLFPFEIEKYLKFHYTKTQEQTLKLLEIYALDGEKLGGEIEHIQMLRQALVESR